MANAVYPLCKQHILQADIDFPDDDVVLVFIDTLDYTYNAAHSALTNIPASARITVGGASPVLASKTVLSGVFDAADITASAVTGDEFEAIVLYQSASTEATSYLICYIDTNVSGLPLTPNGGNVTVTWDNGANKIFAL